MSRLPDPIRDAAANNRELLRATATYVQTNGITILPVGPGARQPQEWTGHGWRDLSWTGPHRRGVTLANLEKWGIAHATGIWAAVDDPWVGLDIDSERDLGYWRERLGTAWDKAAVVVNDNPAKPHSQHRWYRLPPGFHGEHWSASRKQGDFHVRAAGKGGLMMPPSRYYDKKTKQPTGTRYRWLGNGLSDAVTLTEDEATRLLPETPGDATEARREATDDRTRLVALWTPEAVEKAVARELRDIAAQPPGGQNDRLNKSAHTLGTLVGIGALDRIEIEQKLTQAALVHGYEVDQGDRQHDKIAATVGSGLDSGAKVLPLPPSNGEMLAHTDIGNARRLVATHGHDLCYNPALGWLVWDGNRYRPDDTGEIIRRAMDTAVSMLRDAAEIPDPDKRQQAAKWALSSQSLNRITAMTKLAAARPEIARGITEFDTDPWLLSVGNGVIDLRTGNLSPPDRDTLITKGSAVVWDQVARCPQWEEFIDWATGGDTELAAYLQQAAGYTLTGTVMEECLFFLNGNGRNGKGTFVHGIRTVLGSYASAAQSEMLELQQRNGGSGHNDALASLHGARLVEVPETAQGRRWNESLVKQLTGGDALSVSFKGKPTFTFQPAFKMWVHGNHQPAIRGTDDGIWRRLRLVPFRAQVSEDREDRGFKYRMVEKEAPGILRWCVEGCLAWQSAGHLLTPSAVQESTKTYRRSEDTLGLFIEERLVFGVGLRVFNQELRNTYQTWTDAMCEQPVSHKELQKAIGLAGMRYGIAVTLHRSRGGRGLDGVALRPQARIRGNNQLALEHRE